MEQTLQEMIQKFLVIAFDVAGDKVVRDRDRPEKFVITADSQNVILELFDEAEQVPFFVMAISVQSELPMTREIYTEEGWHRPEERHVFNVLAPKTQHDAADFFVKRIDECLSN